MPAHRAIKRLSKSSALLCISIILALPQTAAKHSDRALRFLVELVYSAFSHELICLYRVDLALERHLADIYQMEFVAQALACSVADDNRARFGAWPAQCLA